MASNYDLRTGQMLTDAAVLGGGSTALTICDIYSACDDHANVLGVLEDRFNRAIGPDVTPLEWFQDIEEKMANGQASVQGYVSAFSGEAAELAAIDRFAALGFKAEQFASRIHANDDLHVVGSDGTEFDCSIKSYSSLSDFHQVVADHPTSFHYMVNHEIYEQLRVSGELSEFSAKGVTVLDGGWSHESLSSTAHEAFGDIHDAGDVGRHVPIVALAFFGLKTAQNVKDLLDGRQSQYELGVNIAADGARAIVGGAGVLAGVKLGAGIGTAFLPGLGTLVGAGLGAITGAAAASGLFNWIKEQWKWGDIIDAIEHFGRKVEEGMSPETEARIKEFAFERSKIELALAKEQELASTRTGTMDPYSDDRVTLAGILPSLATEGLRTTLRRIDASMSVFWRNLSEVCHEPALALAGASNQIESEVTKQKNRLMGEILLANADIVFGDGLRGEDLQKARKYRNQLKTSPNHPYRIISEPAGFLKGVALKSLLQTHVETDPYLPASYANGAIGFVLLWFAATCAFAPRMILTAIGAG